MKTMNSLTSTGPGRILLHIASWFPRPSHSIWHCQGIARELLTPPAPACNHLHLRHTLPVIAVALFAFAFCSNGQTSSTTNISFQCALTGTNGQALPNGNYNLAFKFYDVIAGGIALATSSVPNVPVSGGIASTPIPVNSTWFDGQTRYLGVGINGGAELTSRVLVTAVPYALRALSVGDGNGDITWGTGGYLNTDQGASLELGDSMKLGATPYVDFHYGTGIQEDFNVRLKNAANHTLTVQSPLAPVTLAVFGTIGASNSEIDGNLKVGKAASLLGGQIELGLTPAVGIAPPYIDFHNPNGRDQDFNVRLINDADGLLTVYGEQNITVQIRGTTQTRVLQITGGADLAEHLSVTDVQPHDEFQIEPGMVVSIDPTGNRKFKLADEAYDRKRVGIISGGNGVQPGLVLRDEGNPQADGEQPIALTGQVWVHADASFAPIAPGDLLTTSRTPGHAMKVSDDVRARFAVLGQALTGLKEGRGWVQMLVGKQ